mgnify:CR=1 FL=1
MDLQKDKYIIVEVIPTHSQKDKGFIAQISALKLEGITLLDRFDYRVEDRLIENPDLRQIVSYDKKSFTYVDNKYFIIEKFKQWAKGFPLMLMEGVYTPGYLEELDNHKEMIYPHLEMEFSDDVFDRIREKYQLQPSDHLVDLLYEAVIYEGNNKKRKVKKETPKK